MSEPAHQLTPTAGSAEPVANRAPASILLVGVFAVLVYWGMAYLDANAGGFNKQVYSPYHDWDEVNGSQIVDPIEALRRKGKLVFSKNCAACHQPSGLGIPGQFPPLAGSDWVNEKNPNRLVHLVMNGLQGPVKVNGLDFNNSGMLQWKATITDNEEMAAVLTFIRGNKDWGNNAGPVTVEQVKDVRGQTASRTTQYTVPELEKIPLSAPPPK